MVVEGLNQPVVLNATEGPPHFIDAITCNR